MNNAINIKLIKEYMYGYTVEQFCKICNVPVEEFNKIMKSEFDFNIKYLVNISNFMRVSIKKNNFL